MKIRLVFDDWRSKHSGQSIYRTSEGVDLSCGPGQFHAGTTFDATIALDEEEANELRKAITKGYEPTFYLMIDDETDERKTE